KRRATSLYCPEATIHMLPHRMSEDVISLVPGAARRCLSCLYQVNEQFEIVGAEVKPTLIQVKKQYNYDEVDQILEGDQRDHTHRDIYLLYDIAMCYEAQRLASGALKIPKHIVYIYLTDQKDIAHSDFECIEVDENGPAHSLIGEMMILTSSLMADLAVKNNIPLLFRGQEPPGASPLADTTGVPPGPALDYAQRAGLKRSVVTPTPASHATLALEAYAQATSPIRRYGDLCNQRQIWSFLVKGQALYSTEEIATIIDQIEEPLQRAGLTIRETRRFWLQKYLKRKKKKDQTIQGTVLRTDLKNPLVELAEIYMPVLIKTDKDLKRGDVLKLKIAAADPVFDYLKLEIVG
ncbi:ribonuclease catalytic domain-containing protein, partial [Oligoflexia bacterium]|nr:ribonuclease catalytic domain-containing protein [Oligoflexia bacterium]